MIKIEILGQTGETLSVAFYYAVPDEQYLPTSVDHTRNPAGNRLSPAEIEALRQGHLVEYVTTFPLGGREPTVLRSKLEVLHRDHRQAALKIYIQAYGYIGTAWDGQTWS